MISLAYLAGLIDGEGCIGLYKRGNSYALTLDIASNIKPTLERIQAEYGGHIYEATGGLAKHPVYYVRWNGYAAIDLLERIYPHMLTKRTQAWLAREYWAQRTNGHGVPISEGEKALRDGFILMLKNQKHLV